MIFFFNDTATTEIYPLSLHDALPIWTTRTFHGISRTSATALRPCAITIHRPRAEPVATAPTPAAKVSSSAASTVRLVIRPRSAEHTSELQSRQYLVCRLLLDINKTHT